MEVTETLLRKQLCMIFDKVSKSAEEIIYSQVDNDDAVMMLDDLHKSFAMSLNGIFATAAIFEIETIYHLYEDIRSMYFQWYKKYKVYLSKKEMLI